MSELLQEEEAANAQQQAKAAAKAAKRQRQRERQRELEQQAASAAAEVTAAAGAAEAAVSVERSAGAPCNIFRGNVPTTAAAPVPLAANSEAASSGSSSSSNYGGTRSSRQQKESSQISQAGASAVAASGTIATPAATGSSGSVLDAGTGLALAVRPPPPAAGSPAHTMAAAEHGAAVLEPAADVDREAAELEQLMRQLGVGSSSSSTGGSGDWDWSEPLPASPATTAPTPPAARASTLGSSIASPRSFARGLREEVMCPITQEPMTDPVAAADGHNYERVAIEGGWDKGGGWGWRAAAVPCCVLGAPAS
jgi:hypothetical protein